MIAPHRFRPFLFLCLSFLALLPVTACAPGENEREPRPTVSAPTSEPAPVATIAEEVAEVELRESEAEKEASPASPTATVPAPAATLPAATAGRFMDDLLSPADPGRQVEAVQTIVESGDRRFVAVFIELVRARQLEIVSGPYRRYVEALETLSGQSFGDNWAEWVLWYGGTELRPPPGFTGWKGRIWRRIDPRFADFLRDGVPARIRPEEILWGGVGVDGIPPLENPPVLPAADAGYLLPEEPVFGVIVAGEARAYPLRIVDSHEMVNDKLGGVPLSLAYCTLCGAAIAYDGRAPNGETYTFGTSGFLYRSNKLMYDRATGTLWNQLTGRPVLGPLAADEELQLDFFPVVLSAWEDWVALHPDTTVLDRATGVYPAALYEPGALYGHYFSSEETMFPVWQRSDLLEDKAFVYTLHLDGIPKAYPVEALAAEQVVNDRLGETELVLVATRGTSTVRGTSRQLGPVTYSSGAEVRAYARDDYTFAPGPDPYTLLDDQGRTWQVAEAALQGPGGATLPRLDGHLAYWFGWYAFFPDTLLYGSE
jgi:hypothetical protein